MSDTEKGLLSIRQYFPRSPTTLSKDNFTEVVVLQVIEAKRVGSGYTVIYDEDADGIRI